MKAILHALSYGNIELESSRRMADLKQLDAMRIFVKKLDARVYNGEHEVPVRLYFPTEEAMQAGIVEGNTFPILLFFHGGELRPCMCQNGAGNCTYCSFRRIQTGAGA